MPWLAILVIGAGVGFLAGLFGKGGSAIATPLLHAAGVPAIVAVAAPLPATIPSTAVAAIPYARAGLVDRRVVSKSLAVGIVATAVGAFATRWIGGAFLVRLTDVVLALLGVRLLLRRTPDEAGDSEREVRSRRARAAALVPAGDADVPPAIAAFEREDLEGPSKAASHDVSSARIVAVAAVVGFASGLLANSGGFLLAPLYITVLKLPVKVAFACSLAVAAVLAIPGTVVHALLGHIRWDLVAVFGLASIPSSYIGARVALRTSSGRLERLYGLMLAIAGIAFFLRRG